MKKYGYIAWMLILGLLLALPSCKDDDDEDDAIYLPVDEQWKEMNLAAYEARLQDVKTDTSLFTINSASGNGQIICKILKKGEGTEPIYYTSLVNCYYKGCFVADEDGNVIANRDSVPSLGEVFDSALEENGDNTVMMTGGCTITDAYGRVSGTTDGFATALQNMHVGDVWEIWVPYQLGYGARGSETIQPYTTLVFQIEVESIEEQ